MRSIEEQQGEQLFNSYFKALQSLRKQGFKYKEQFSIKEDKMLLYKKGKRIKVLTSRYNRYVGAEWVVRSW
jgi:hypothetical protein|tara:strand:+ start:334 stop:546 length:213 start_codon:yes stop_codon:yes gene_type:complete